MDLVWFLIGVVLAMGFFVFDPWKLRTRLLRLLKLD